MTLYQPPSSGDLFQIIDPNDDPHDDIDHSTFLPKSGGTMTGRLIANGNIQFSDGTVQYTAYDDIAIINSKAITDEIDLSTNVNVIPANSNEILVMDKLRINSCSYSGDTYTPLINSIQGAFYDTDRFNITRNTNNINQMSFFNFRITKNENDIATLENSMDNGEHNLNIGINGTNINSISKSLHNNSTHIYKNVMKCNDLLTQTSNITSDIETNIKVDIQTNKNEIQQSKTDIINANTQINNNTTKLSHTQTTWDRFTITSFEDRDIFLNSGDASIWLYSNEVRFGNEQNNSYFILNNGERQYRAYTNQIHDYYMLKIEELSERVNYLVYENEKREKLENGIAPNDPDWISQFNPIDFDYDYDLDYDSNNIYGL